jgi:hypothetical protein
MKKRDNSNSCDFQYPNAKTSIKRRKTRQIKIGEVAIGGDAPIVVQSMTKTDTNDIEQTVAQIKSLEKVGCEVVRIAVPDKDAVEAFGKIKKQVSLPVVADIRCFAHQPRQYWLQRESKRSCAGGEGSCSSYKNWGEFRLFGEEPAPQVRRGLPGGYGRECYETCENPGRYGLSSYQNISKSI